MRYSLLKKSVWWSEMFESSSPSYLYWDNERQHFDVASHGTIIKHHRLFEFEEETVEQMKKDYPSLEDEFVLVRAEGDIKRAELIDELKHQVRKNSFRDFKELERFCEAHEIFVWEDILHPIEWNCCEKCGSLWPSEELYWLDYMEEISPELERGLAKEGMDYCCLCEDCVKALVEDGRAS